MDSDFPPILPLAPLQPPQTDSVSDKEEQLVRMEFTKLRAQELELSDMLKQLRSEIERHKHELAAARNKVEGYRIDRVNLSAEVENLRKAKEQLLGHLKPLREELDERIGARETLIHEVTILHGHIENLQNQKRELEDEVKASATACSGALPLLFSDESQPISKRFHSRMNH